MGMCLAASGMLDLATWVGVLQVAVGWPDAANLMARHLARRPDLADRLVGIAGDFVPARTAFGPRFLWDLLRA